MADGPAGFTQDFSCPALLRVPLRFAWLRVRGVRPLWQGVPTFSTHHVSCDVAALQPHACRNTHGLGSSPFARHYLGNHCYFLFLRVLRCFSSPRWPLHKQMSCLQHDGLSHSEIGGSKVICTYPPLIAAYHVLHRLSEPRHPPSALIYFLTIVDRTNKYIRLSFAHTFSFLFVVRSLELLFYSLACVNMSKIFSGTCPGVENNGFEPLTPCLQSRCSSQLS